LNAPSDKLSDDAKKGLQHVRDNWDKLQDLTEMVGNTPTMTGTSLSNGLQARYDTMESIKDKLDRAEGKTVETQSEWRADHRHHRLRREPPEQITPAPVPPKRPDVVSPIAEPKTIAPLNERTIPQRREPAEQITPAPLPPKRPDVVSDIAEPKTGPPLKERTIWNYKVKPAHRDAELPIETPSRGEAGDSRAGQRVTDPRVLAQVPDATYIGLKGDITLADQSARQGWVRQSDQPYWLAGRPAHAFLWAQEELAKVGKKLDVSGLNGAGRLHSQEEAIRARGVFAAPSSRISNHEVGRALDIDNWSDPDVSRVLRRAGFRQGDRRGPIGNDLHHFSFAG
jgi:hypothetical protein